MKNLRGLGKLKSFNEIGKELGFSKDVAKKNFDRAIEKIMSELERYDDETRNLILNEIFETSIFE